MAKTRSLPSCARALALVVIVAFAIARSAEGANLCCDYGECECTDGPCAYNIQCVVSMPSVQQCELYLSNPSSNKKSACVQSLDDAVQDVEHAATVVCEKVAKKLAPPYVRLLNVVVEVVTGENLIDSACNLMVNAVANAVPLDQAKAEACDAISKVGASSRSSSGSDNSPPSSNDSLNAAVGGARVPSFMTLVLAHAAAAGAAHIIMHRA